MKRFIITLSISVILLYGARSVHASTLMIVAPQAVVSADGLATVDLRIDSEGATVNAVQTTVTYDTSMLEFVSVTPDPAFVSLWTEPPHLVSPGTIEMSGGKPGGAFLLDVAIAQLTFKPLQGGTATIAIDEERSGVYEHDGFGSMTPLTVHPLTLAISDALNLLAQPTSMTHFYQSEWSSERTFTVVWNVFPNDEVSYVLSRDQSATPDDTPDENLGTVTYPNLGDGMWYFTFKERARGSPWSSVARRMVRIDGTPPEPFAVVSTRDRQGGTGLLSFVAQDATSGIASYLVRIVEKSWWNPWDATVTTVRASGVLELGDPSGITEVDVTAFDHAGNGRVERWYGEHPRRSQFIFMASLLFAAAVLAGLLLLVIQFTRRVRRTPTRSIR